MKSVKTRWFPVGTPPVHHGEYEICFAEDGSGPANESRRLWDGLSWSQTWGRSTMFGDNARDKWRGLAKKP